MLEMPRPRHRSAKEGNQKPGTCCFAHLGVASLSFLSVDGLPMCNDRTTAMAGDRGSALEAPENASQSLIRPSC
jgi:hypothetical protein